MVATVGFTFLRTQWNLYRNRSKDLNYHKNAISNKKKMRLLITRFDIHKV